MKNGHVPLLDFLLLFFVAHENEEDENSIEGVAKIRYNEHLFRHGFQFPLNSPRNNFHGPIDSHSQKQFQIQVESMKITAFEFCFTENIGTCVVNL